MFYSFHSYIHIYVYKYTFSAQQSLSFAVVNKCYDTVATQTFFAIS